MNENIIVPPLHPLLADRNRGRGRPDQITEKTLRVFFFFFFFFFFFCNYIFLRFKRVETFIGGGGGCNFLLFFFFFGGGGGVGGCKSLFL